MMWNKKNLWKFSLSIFVISERVVLCAQIYKVYVCVCVSVCVFVCVYMYVCVCMCACMYVLII